MGHFSLQCPCARAAAKSCSLCCCSRFRSLHCSLWWRRLRRLLPAKFQSSSGSSCLWPTMWCLLLAVSSYLQRCCTPNDTRICTTWRADGCAAQLRDVPGHGCRTHRTAPGRGLSHYLLPRAFRLDGFRIVLCQFCSIDSVLDKTQRQSRYDRVGHGGSRSRLLHCCAGDWSDLGAAGLGYLVDLGSSADFDIGDVVDLCELPHAEALFLQWTDPRHSRSDGDFWGP